jgi:hypothetical protein
MKTDEFITKFKYLINDPPVKEMHHHDTQRTQKTPKPENKHK